MSVTLALTPTPTVSLTLTPNPEQVIDVGCATGHTMLALLRRAAFKAVHGVDSYVPTPHGERHGAHSRLPPVLYQLRHGRVSYQPVLHVVHVAHARL